MKYLACTLILMQLFGCGTTSTASTNSAPLAFEGAQGFGKYTVGGRGGQVYVVSNLHDNPVNPQPGSLRYAIKQQGPRQIVFSVSGVIKLKKSLEIKHDNITINGQTSPKGIVIAGANTSIEASQVIIRYLRFRPGHFLQEGDALSSRNQSDVIIDHCSLSWANDEVGSFYNNTRFTLQHSILSESLKKSTHHKGSHGYGGIWGGRSASFIYNVLAHHYSRVPRVNGHRLKPQYPANEELTDIRNNVFYNWQSNSGYGGEGGAFNLVGNYYRAGPATKANRYFQFSSDSQSVATQAFIANNVMHGEPTMSEDNHLGVRIKNQKKLSAKSVADIYKLNSVPALHWPANNSETPIPPNALLAWQTLIVEKDVGANRNEQGVFMDSIDTRILHEIATGTVKQGNGIIDTEFDVIPSWDVYSNEFSDSAK